MIEVVAAIAIMGTLLSGMLLAKSRHTRQLALAQRQLVAVELLDNWLAERWVRPENLPVNEAGVVAGPDQLRWTTRLIPNEQLAPLSARVLRVEFHDNSDGGPHGHAASQGSSPPLVSVDLILPNPASTATANERSSNGPRSER